MKRLIIRNGNLMRPGGERMDSGTIVVEEDKIAAVVGPNEGPVNQEPGDEVIDAKGNWVVPGLIDMRASLREPGYEQHEDIASGLKAAAAGGITSVLALPDTDPVMDNAAVVSQVLELARRADQSRLCPIGAATVGLADESLAPIGEMAEQGCVAITQGEKPIKSARLMRRLLDYTSVFDLPVISSAIEPTLAGVCDEGYWSTRLGLPSTPAAAEWIAIERDLGLAELTNARLHLTRVSTARGLEAIARAKDRGVKVTCDVTAHHLHLNTALLQSYDPNLKVWPPLRSEEDVQALRDGVASGLVDAICSDHQPFHIHNKTCEFVLADTGIMGLETLLPLVLRSVHLGHFSRERAVAALTTGPGQALGRGSIGLQAGRTADLTIIDTATSWILSEGTIRSRSRNTPFAGELFKGRAATTVVGGKIIYQMENPAEARHG
jgi:dihydroorotase